MCVLVPVHKYTFCVVSWERQDKTYCLLLVGLVVLAVCFCLWGGGGGSNCCFLYFLLHVLFLSRCLSHGLSPSHMSLSLSHIMSLSACLWAAGFSELTHRQTELERIFPFFLIDEVAHLSADVSSKYFRERYVICIVIVCVFQWNGEETK